MPRYEIVTDTDDQTSATRLHDRDRQAQATIYPEFGFNCTHFQTTPDAESSAPTAVFLPPANPTDLRDQSPFMAGNPILFPFPNRVRGGVYTFEGQTYRMDKLMALNRDRGAGQAIHGLVGDKPWTLEETGADDDGAFLRGSLQLDAFPDIHEQYPFPCKITVTYRLRDGVLEMHTEVANTGDRALPMGFGIHPWFPARLRPGANLPQDLGQITMAQRSLSEVHVPTNALWQLESLMPTGKTIAVREADAQFDLQNFAPLRDNFYDHVFTEVEHRADGWSEGGLRDLDSRLEMWIAADAGFREWVLYAPLTSPVIALEPYTCTTDAVNLQAQGLDAGLIALASGQTWAGDIHFGLRRLPA